MKKYHIGTTIPGEVLSVIQKSGSNESAFLRVIQHYCTNPKDSLKLKAAFFLMQNMDGFFFYKGKMLDKYVGYLKLLRKDANHGEFIMKSLSQRYGAFSYDVLKREEDIQTTTSDEMINNIDMAFRVWDQQPWGRDYSFEEFCEYILPFRIQSAVPENNRRKIYHQFNKLLDSVRIRKGSAIDACRILNNKLITDNWLFTPRVGFLPNFRASELIRYRAGNCTGMADLATYVMRSVGIPVVTDFVPQWPYRNGSHTWNAIPDRNGKFLDFLGAEYNPEYRYKPGTKKGKVYRRTYAINPASIAATRDPDDLVPDFLNDPRITDVTDQYAKCYNPEIPVINHGHHKYAFLNVFDNVDWKPIAWGKISNEKVVFNKVEGGIAYLPAYYDNRGNIPANYPFILDTNGAVKELKPAIGNTNKKMTLTQMYPDMPDDVFLGKLDGGCFEGANNVDFDDADTLYSIVGKPNPSNEIKLNSSKRYQYVRYLSAPNQPVHLSEVEFCNFKNKLNGSIIGSKEPTRSWVGLDLGKPMAITKIRFAAKKSTLPYWKIILDQKYELFYWDNNTWNSLGVQIASELTVTFTTKISNALFKLQYVPANPYEQRVFTYENEHQIWW